MATILDVRSVNDVTVTLSGYVTFKNTQFDTYRCTDKFLMIHSLCIILHAKAVYGKGS